MMIALYIAGGLAHLTITLGVAKGMHRYDDDTFDRLMSFLAALLAWPLIVIYKIVKDFMESR